MITCEIHVVTWDIRVMWKNYEDIFPIFFLFLSVFFLDNVPVVKLSAKR